MALTRRDVWAVVGALVFVEFVSGVMQGYYLPLAHDIGRHLHVPDADLNWLEAAQFLVSALCVPPLARLADYKGHQKVLLVSAVVVAVANWALVLAPNFAIYLTAWAVQGVFTVWLPLEVAIIFWRARTLSDRDDRTRRGAGYIVAALEFGAIFGALSSGMFSGWFPQLWMVLAVPAVLSTVVVLVVRFAVPKTEAATSGTLDVLGVALLSTSLLLVTAGLMLVRVLGPGSPWPWLAMALGLAVLWPFGRHELATAEPLLDLRMLRKRTMWPVQVTSGLFGISVLGAQIPLSTFAQTDPHVYGYGLGMTASTVAPLIGAYVLSLLVGALLFAQLSHKFSTRHVLLGATLLVAVGYLALVPLHHSVPEVASLMIVAGLGSGALVAALPAVAAAAAPQEATGVATGLTNTTKTLGGALASALFGVALAAGVTGGTAASLSGYFTVWITCAAAAACAAILLYFVPRGAFDDAHRERATS